MGTTQPTFGDKVRIKSVPVTEDLKLAGLGGSVYGETTPSVTGVKVIGNCPGDYAINVMIESRGEAFWFSPELVEFVDHGAGTKIKIGNHELIRDANGEWKEVN